MSDIVLNPDGTSIWTDAREKLEAVKSALEVHLKRIETKVIANEKSGNVVVYKLKNGLLGNRLSEIFIKSALCVAG